MVLELLGYHSDTESARTFLAQTATKTVPTARINLRMGFTLSLFRAPFHASPRAEKKNGVFQITTS